MSMHTGAAEDPGGDSSPIEGIFNYCDRRCERCRFTSRCTLRRMTLEDEARHPDSTLAEAVERSLVQTCALIEQACAEHGIDVETAADEGAHDTDRLLEDPLVVLGHDYATMTHPILSALEPIVVLRNDPALTEATQTIEWFHVMVAAKIFRAVVGLDDEPGSEEVQTDFNGSAKVARIAVAESLAAWRVLMEIGKATADGVPARAVAMLKAIDAALEQRFPRAEAFVRPGFDEPSEPASADGHVAT